VFLFDDGKSSGFFINILELNYALFPKKSNLQTILLRGKERNLWNKLVEKA
jgi:hypothetical protein